VGGVSEPVVEKVLDEEGARREHLCVALGGSRAFGFPSPSSDYDLECIHVAPTAKLVGLTQPTLTFDRIETIDGVKIDYTSNEVALVISGILGGNGNFLERVLGRAFVRRGPLFEELVPLVQRSVSKRLSRHYRGFATGQVGELEKDPTVKKLLYVLRTLLAGTHLLRTGALEPDLPTLLREHALREAEPLVAAKRAGERTAREPSLLEEWRPRIAALFEAHDAALVSSPLPDAPPPEAIAAMEAWLLSVRRARFL
jgi:predicted nucleotidyltransferase